MTVFLGNKGNIRLRRSSTIAYGTLEDVIIPDDISEALNRLSFERAVDNLLTGDRVDISTTDPRGLIFISPEAWSDGEIHTNISLFININAVGGLRFFKTFEQAVNNDRTYEISLSSFTFPEIPIRVAVRDARYNILGSVTSYRFSTDRDTIDTTSLQDKFKQQYNAGLISGSGTIECLFNDRSTAVAEPSMLILQLIQRVDIGCDFDLALYLSDKELNPNEDTIFYDVTGVVTRAGVAVTSGDIITCTVDFVTTGEVRLLVGKPSDYILKEDDDRIGLEQSLNYLLQEIED
jgi:hypothetical protein